MVKRYAQRNRTFLIATVVIALALTVACGKFSFFSPSCVGEGCNASASQTKNGTPSPTPTPSATPTPSPTPTPTLNCRIDSLVFDSGPEFLAVDGVGTFQMTPWQIDNVTQSPVKVDDRCNQPKAELVEWKSSSVVGKVTKNIDGFSATVKRVGIGDFIVSATLDGRTVSRTVR